MSPATLVTTILVLGWNAVLALAAALTETGPFRSTSSQSTSLGGRTMRLSSRTVRVDVCAPEFDARAAAQATEGDGGPTKQAQSTVINDSEEKDVDVCYADASVRVMTDDGVQLRQCSVCMN